MNSTFSINRYLHFERTKLKQTILQLIGIVILFEVLFFLSVIAQSLGFWSYFPLSILYTVSIILIIIAPIIFEPKLNKNNIIYLYTLPISKTERFVSYIMRYVIIQPILWIILYYIAAYLQPYLLPDLLDQKSFVNFISGNKDNIPMYYAAQSIGMIIYLSVRKYVLAMHIAVLFIIIYLVTLIGLISTYIYLDHSITYSFFVLLNPTFYLEKWTGEITTITLLSGIILNLVMTIGLWSIIYLKIKEFKI